MEHIYSFTEKVWLYPGMSAWRFISLPKKTAADIKKLFGHLTRGWGSLRVEAQIGKTKWKTSLFPDKKSDTYLLPIKANVRKSESIEAGGTTKVTLSILL